MMFQSDDESIELWTSRYHIGQATVNSSYHL